MIASMTIEDVCKVISAYIGQQVEINDGFQKNRTINYRNIQTIAKLILQGKAILMLRVLPFITNRQAKDIAEVECTEVVSDWDKIKIGQAYIKNGWCDYITKAEVSELDNIFMDNDHVHINYLLLGWGFNVQIYFTAGHRLNGRTPISLGIAKPIETCVSSE